MKLEYNYSKICNRAFKQGKKITDLYTPVKDYSGRTGWMKKQTKLSVKINKQQFNYN